MADYDTAVNDESPTPPLRPITSCASLATDVSDTPEPTKLPPAHLRFSLPKNDSSKSGASSSNSLHFVPSLSAHFARSNSGHENNIDKTSQQQQRHYINCNSNSPPERMRLAKRKLSLDEPSLKPLKRRDVSATPSAASSSSSSSSSSRSSSPVLSRPESPIAPLSQPSHVLGLQQHQQQPQNSNHQFQCHFCASVFMRNQDLTRHVASVHEKTRLFTCPGCPGTRFSRKDALKRHVRTFKCCPIDLIR
ncbi:hypothetical protein HK100_002550 [Physocladia obscura]|uniref:C2H2-type domain-containing protein n=1 Tax=Physocladia obscura TaxID=109957 RepID=A0AAD5SVH8_9FUNG|nr:hypothetical protein HK100_002550 [Physocladia obscura]